MENPFDVWGSSLDRRIQAYNEQRSLIERQFAEVAQARQGLDRFGEELKLEIDAFQSAKTQQKPVQRVPGQIPPLRPSAREVPVIRQETALNEGLGEEEEFFTEETDAEEAPMPQKPQHIVSKPPLQQKPQPVVSEQPKEPVKGSFDSKALFARLK